MVLKRTMAQITYIIRRKQYVFDDTETLYGLFKT